eukprot:TRINITY_DN2814_c0_g1_i1.p1 TRINITY_DN2814_c0_g1~~TRINITY_DN2814_c0_g1_i1.p1  ORF type:complete len:335 (-),score=126.38 TRINITY_DN2814_c0_g1_i1:50-1054(-)
MRRSARGFVLLFAALLLCISLACSAARQAPQLGQALRLQRRRGGDGVQIDQGLSKVLALRGGVRKAALPDAAEDSELSEDAPKKQSAGQLVKESLLKLQPATRTFLLLVLSANVLELAMGALLGVDAKEVFVASWPRTILNLELWRPLTAAMYLGPISMHWATNVYFLITYGSHLEAVNGTAEQIVFLLTAFVCVTILGALIGLPVVSTSLISACVYGSARVDPLGSVPFQFGLQMPRWLLPYGLAVVDFLQAGKIEAAIPHAVGILAGHFYTFNRNTLPLMGGRDWLRAPGWLQRRADGGGGATNFMERPKKTAAKKKTATRAKAEEKEASEE